MMLAGEVVKRKHGGAKLEDHEREEYLESLDAVSKKLQEQYPSAKFDRKSVGHLVANIKQFVEDALGIKALPPRPSPKIPVKLFRDTSPEGALHIILSKFHEGMTARQLKRVDFTNPYHRKQLLEIFAQVVHELVKRGLLKWPKVFVDPSCGVETPLLQSMILSMKGETAPSADAEGVTHHVLPFGPKGDPDDGVQYMRNLGKRGDKVAIHWWYYPDSYDELVVPDDAPELVEPDKQAEGPWKVYARWVKDSAKYNEWMNPIDYEVDDVPPDKPTEAGAAASTGVKVEPGKGAPDAGGAAGVAAGAAATSQPPPVVAPPIPVPVRVPELDFSRAAEVQPGCTKHHVLQPDSRFLNPAAHALNLPAKQGAAPGPAPQATDGGPVGDPSRIPVCASWFDFGAVHDIERQSCPEVFAKLPEGEEQVYIQARNNLVRRYREGGGRRLTFRDACQGAEVATDLLPQVWGFLDAWGLINNLAPAEGAAGGAGTAADDTESQKVTAKYAAALEGVKAVVEGGAQVDLQKGLAAAAGKAKVQTEGPQAKRRKLQHSTPVPEARFFCNAKPWVECTNVRYHCKKRPDVDLCPEAFAEGRFPAGCTAADFVRIDQNDLQAGEEWVWSDMDTLLLLEGLELYGDNWDKISDHVGNKSQVQCITHFLRLPIEDDFLDQLEHRGPAAAMPLTGGSAGGDGAAGPQLKIPFADERNPVMSQVSFLAAAIEPQVAAAAAQEALQVLMEGFDQATTSATPGSGGGGGPSPEVVRQAASAGLRAAAVEARLLVDVETEEESKLVGQATGLVLDLAEQRMKQSGLMETALGLERTSRQAHKEALVAERARLQSAKPFNPGTGFAPSVPWPQLGGFQVPPAASSSRPA